jgi:uncharacterized protein
MNKKIIFIAIAFVFMLMIPSFAMFKLPTPVGYVNDFANVITDSDEANLNSIILELKEKTQAEVVVVTMNSLENYPIEDVGLEIGRQWKVGQKGKDNGLIVLVAPNDKKMRIEVGYGLEGAIPDSKAGRIRDEYMIPNFKVGDYSKGIAVGTSIIVGSIAKDYGVTISKNYNYVNQVPPKSQKSSPLVNFVFIAMFLFVAIKYPRFTMLMLLSGGGGRSDSSSGSFGGFSGGGGFGGGGSSGGW